MRSNKKEDPTVEIDSLDFYNAQERWVNFWGDQKIPIHSFVEFLGMHKNTRITYLTAAFNMKIRKSAALKIKKLNSPHWYAILKYYQLRKRR